LFEKRWQYLELSHEPVFGLAYFFRRSVLLVPGEAFVMKKQQHIKQRLNIVLKPWFKTLVNPATHVVWRTDTRTRGPFFRTVSPRKPEINDVNLMKVVSVQYEIVGFDVAVNQLSGVYFS